MIISLFIYATPGAVTRPRPDPTRRTGPHPDTPHAVGVRARPRSDMARGVLIDSLDRSRADRVAPRTQGPRDGVCRSQQS